MKKPIIRMRETVNAKVKGISVSRSWHCEISRLAHVTIDGLKGYVADLGINPVSVETLAVKRGQPPAMHIEVPFYSKRQCHE